MSVVEHSCPGAEIRRGLIHAERGACTARVCRGHIAGRHAAGITRPDGGDGRRPIRNDSANLSQAEARADRDGHAWARRTPETPSRFDDRASVAADGVARSCSACRSGRCTGRGAPRRSAEKDSLVDRLSQSAIAACSGRVTSLPTQRPPCTCARCRACGRAAAGQHW